MRKLRRAGATFMAIPREIFDESAYLRFLQRTGQLPSRDSYREFLLQRVSRPPSPRCC